jgi:hypothetical protein
MIFDKCEDIENDIKSKISSYIKQNNDCEDIRDLVSIIRSYLYEMKIIKEIESFDVNEINRNKFDIIFYKDKVSYKFGISMDLELRNLKIKRIISNKVLD